MNETSLAADAIGGEELARAVHQHSEYTLHCLNIRVHVYYMECIYFERYRVDLQKCFFKFISERFE